MAVTLILRGQSHEVKSGMALRDALLKLSILPETVLATRAGVMITEDEILHDGDIVKLVMVISGGSDTRILSA